MFRHYRVHKNLTLGPACPELDESNPRLFRHVVGNKRKRVTTTKGLKELKKNF
jgi:hypothetical protein